MKLGWKFDSEFSFLDDNFSKIYRFYVLETPVSNVSVREKTFKQRKIDMRKLPNKLKKSTPFLNDFWYEEKSNQIEWCCKNNEIFDFVRKEQEIAIHTSSKSSKTESLFYAIRCAFAHGAFATHIINGEKYYFLENRDKNKLKARLILKEETLLLWIKLVKGSTK